MLNAPKGLLLTGIVMSVEEPRNFSGMTKTTPSRPYSMNRRRFQIFANKVLYDCQDSREDDKDAQGNNIPGSGLTKFCTLEEMQPVSFVVEKIEVGKALQLSYDLKTD